MEQPTLIDKLNKNGSRLSKSHRKLAEFISQHYDKAVFMTAARLAQVVGISPAAVSSRLIKARKLLHDALKGGEGHES